MFTCLICLIISQQAWSACTYLKEDPDKSKCTDRTNATGCDLYVTETSETNTSYKNIGI